MSATFKSVPARGLAAVFLWVAISASCGSPADPTPTPTPDPPPAYEYEELVKQFEYDASAPLDIQETDVLDAGVGVVHYLSYLSPKGGRVPAFLMIPDGAGPFPAVVFLHWGVTGGDKSEFLPDATELAKLGAASLSIDAPFVRPGWSGSRGDPIYLQTVLDLRRAADLLQARADIDPARLAFCGHSYGATWGGVLAGVDHRFQGFILMAGHPEIGLCDNCGEPASEKYWAKYYIGHAAPASLLFQFARQDRWITQAAAEKYYAAASDPKSLIWYDTDHGFNNQAMLDRLDWLKGLLDL